MRFIVFMIPDPKGYLAGQMPTNEAIAKMTDYNEQLVKAGVMLGGDGLHPPSKAIRVELASGKPKVIDGPFAEAKEIIGGFWLWQTKTREEAIEWARRCPTEGHVAIELRQIFEMEDFAPSPEVDRAYALQMAEKK